MDATIRLYRMICDAAGKSELSDQDIGRIASFLQRGLGETGDLCHICLCEPVHIDADAS